MDKISTKKLVQKAKKGDGQAFVHLCQKYETVYTMLHIKCY